MTFFESLFVVGVFMVYIKWVWRSHLEELDRRIKELAVRLNSYDLSQLNESQTGALVLARKQLDLAYRFQKAQFVREADLAVAEGNRLADSIDNDCGCDGRGGHKRSVAKAVLPA